MGLAAYPLLWVVKLGGCLVLNDCVSGGGGAGCDGCLKSK